MEPPTPPIFYFLQFTKLKSDFPWWLWTQQKTKGKGEKNHVFVILAEKEKALGSASDIFINRVAGAHTYIFLCGCSI